MSTEITILFGSQTGCSEDVAERIRREAKFRGFRAKVLAMDDYDKIKLPIEKCVVFVCSTTGQGDEPDNMKQFWRFLLRKDLPKSSLTQVYTAVFGLGDSSYPKFNFAAKKLYKRLIQLGAKMLVERGDGDDQHELGLDGALDPWLTQFWKIVEEKFPLDHVPEPEVGKPRPTFNIVFEPSTSKLPSSNHIPATMTRNLRITSSTHFQDVRMIELDTNAEYQPGDVCNFYPENLADEVEQVIQHFNWQDLADKPMHIVSNDADRPVPRLLHQVDTLRQALIKALDIFGRPRRYFFELVSYFATNPTQAEKLKEFSTAAGQSDLYAYCYRPKRTIFEVMQDFDLDLDVNYLCDLIPLLRPRSFSISSDPLTHPGKIQLTVAIVKYKTKLRKPRVGVCTKWLSQLQTPHSIPIWITKGTMKLPSPETPIICISPGTGIAPMKSFLEHRIEQRHTGKNTLFLGIRNVEGDFFYQHQFEDWEDKGDLKLIVAASRDQDEKIYVQHRLKEHGGMVWQIIQDGGHLYLSGNASQMPKDVSDALKTIFQKYGKMSEEEAASYLQQLESTGRFQQECWT